MTKEGIDTQNVNNIIIIINLKTYLKMLTMTMMMTMTMKNAFRPLEPIQCTFQKVYKFSALFATFINNSLFLAQQLTKTQHFKGNP